MTFVVGPTGLPLMRYSDWRLLREERWRDAYGPDADVRPETPDGLMIDTLTLGDTMHGDATQSVWANSFFRTASGPALDLILDLFGRTRLAATPTTVSAVWYGEPATVVHDGAGVGPVASVVSPGDGDGDRYAIDDGQAGTLPALADDGAIVVLAITRGVTGDAYAIEFDAVEQVIAAADEVTQTIAEALAVEIESTWPDFTVTTTGPAGADESDWLIIIEGKGTAVPAIGPSATAPDNVSLWTGVRLSMSAEETGPQILLAGTLRIVESPEVTAEGVTTTEDGDPGRDVEPDGAFRARHWDQINVGGKGTPQRIRAAILDELPDPLTEYVRVDENVTNVVVEGRPPHSFEVTWIGTATAEQVAAVVFDQKPAGIRAYGSTEVEVLDVLGDGHRIGVSEGEELFLHLDITLTTGEGYPTSGDPAATILESIVDYLTLALGLGQDLYLYQLAYPIVGAVPGIIAAAITADATPDPLDAPALIVSDVTVAPNQILRVSSTRIDITIA